MMKASSCSLFLILVFTEGMMIHPSLCVNDSQLSSICSKTTSPSFCMRALRSDRRTTSSDLQGLGHVSVDLARSKASATLSMVHSLSRRAAQPELKQRLLSCSEYYTSAVSLLEDAKQSLASADYGRVADRAVTAMDKSEDCDDEFEAGPPDVPRLRRMNDDMENLCSMVFAVAGSMG
ncbi:hypothetical protein SAY86_015330 [Trapa natans]|uniref:Pectinesterase inhibitor domain-containing protein n=1 Tax=Trapa natans TaxID=22666 RepID=A0AAN7KJ85_TRANT|nr:hypothetical protein SAY86_015330 [Trapa natans]